MTTLHVQTFGEGRPLVALHGVTSHGGRFRRLAAEHLPGFAVHAFDLLGHGHSPWQPPWGLDWQVQSVLATMDELGLEQTDLLGFSYGGLVALHLASQAPHRVRGLVLMDPAIGLPAAMAQQGAISALTGLSFPGLPEATQWRAAAWPAATEQDVQREIDEHLTEGDDGSYRWRYQPAAVVVAYSEMARPALLPPAGMPTLLLRAAQEQIVQPDFAKALRDAGAEQVDLDSRHHVMLERPVETGTAVYRFLAGLE